MAQHRSFLHSVIGPVHEIVPRDRSARALGEAISHEIDDCGAIRILIDLAGQSELEPDQVDVIIEMIEPDDRRWAVRLPTRVSADEVRRLHAAGLDARMISEPGA